MRLKHLSPVLLMFLLFADAVPLQAGFGVSPPNIISDRVRPGTIFEQTIYLLRSSAEEKKNVEISVNAPEIDSWISFDRGKKFVLPENQIKIPLKLIIKVPANADIGNYRGKISVHIFSEKEEKSSGLSVATGAEININLTLSEEIIKEFLVLDVKIKNFVIKKEPFNWPFFMNFFQRLKLDLKIENTGNFKSAPDKITVDVYDLNEIDLYASGESDKLKKINPFQISETSVSIPLLLEPGQFWGKVKVYNKEKVIYANNIAFSAAYSEEESGVKYLFFILLFISLIFLLFIFNKPIRQKIGLQKIFEFLLIAYKAIIKNTYIIIKNFWRKIFEIADKNKK